MTTSKVKASELVDAECMFVSLVPKGANRIPFRIIKQENGRMKLDLGSVFKKDTESFVASVMVSKTCDIEAAKALVIKAGFKTDAVEEKDGMLIFKQADAADSDEQLVVYASEDIALHIATAKGFCPFDFEETSFAELFAQAGVMPQLSAASDILDATICNILCNQDTKNPADASTLIKQAIKEYSGVVTALVANIPVQAFKMEAVLKNEKPVTEKSTTSATKKEDTDMTVTKTEAEIKAEADAAAVKKTADDKAAADKVAAEKAEKEKTDKEAADKAAAEKAEADKKSAEQSDLAGVLKALEALQKSVSGVTEQMTALGTRVEEVAKTAKESETALKGVTLAEAPGDKGNVQKTAISPKAPLRDSGYRKAKF